MKKILILTALLFFANSVQAMPEKIDMTKWQYNSAENVFYQLEISYCDNPIDEKSQKLGIFVPAQYMKCTQNDDETYSCRIDNKGIIKNYTAKTAPIVMPALDFNPVLNEYKSVWEYTSEGFVYVYAGSGRNPAPAFVTDLKAAVRYIKYNKNIIPGNVDRIFSFGMAESVILGVTGDSKLYQPYLKQIGAILNKSDKILGSASWCPIVNLDTANIAYEWNLASSRENMDEETKKISNSMSYKFVEYINDAKFRREDGTLLTLRETNKGIYQAGSYYNYLEQVVNQSLTNFLADTLFPIEVDKKVSKSDEEETSNEVYNSAEEYINALNSDKKWINHENYKVKILNMEDFVKHMKPATKPVGAFDGLERQQKENELFGDGQKLHFDRNTAEILKDTKYAKDFSKDFEKIDFAGNNVQARVNMYNPLYFLMPYYDGYKTSKVAKYWRIRSGLSQTETSLTTEVNLSLALKNFLNPKNVDFETIWGAGHIMAERRGTPSENFVNWVNNCD